MRWYRKQMRYLGIDFGTKRIGLALSDEEGMIAYPHSVVKNTKNTLDDIMAIYKKEGAQEVVIGESKNLDGTPNPIMEDIDDFVAMWTMVDGVVIHYEPEFYSSHQAVKMRGKDAKHDKIDASAAAIILQSYLDRLKNKKERGK